MNEERRIYRMTVPQRHTYVTLLFSGSEKAALKFRDDCDTYWTEHPEEWEKVRAPDDVPIPL